MLITANVIKRETIVDKKEMKPIEMYDGVERDNTEDGMINVIRWGVYPNNTKYMVSTIGSVKNIATKRLLKQSKTAKGYWVVTLSNNSSRKQCRVHRMVLSTFIGKCPLGMECNHKNGIKSDNRLTNLEWTTHSDNIKHAYKVGLKCAVGEGNGQSKLTKKNVSTIRNLCTVGNRQVDVAKKFNVNRSTICRIVSGAAWANVV